MTTATDSNSTNAPDWRWWRDWLLMSLAAVFVISLLAAHLPPSLKTIVVFPIGVGIVCGMAIGKCAELVGERPSLHLRWLQVFCVASLLLAGFAHVYWIVFDGYLDDARETIAEQLEDSREREQIAAAIVQRGEGMDEAGVSALLQPPPPLPTFFDYLSQRLQSDRLPRYLTLHPWPAVVFGCEILIATTLGVWLAVGGRPVDKVPPRNEQVADRGPSNDTSETPENTV